MGFDEGVAVGGQLGVLSPGCETWVCAKKTASTNALDDAAPSGQRAAGSIGRADLALGFEMGRMRFNLSPGGRVADSKS